MLASFLDFCVVTHRHTLHNLITKMALILLCMHLSLGLDIIALFDPRVRTYIQKHTRIKSVRIYFLHSYSNPTPQRHKSFYLVMLDIFKDEDIVEI